MHVSKARVHSIDLLRGLVIAIMTVDHVREDFLHTPVLTDPMDISTVGVSLFFTRWIAHFCAPVFVFLTGVSAYLHASRWDLSPQALSGFLLRRGLLLILMEITFVNVAWTLVFPPERIYLQVIWAIGCSMIFLSALSLLPRCWLFCLSLIIVAGHNMLDNIAIPSGSVSHWLWAFLHERTWLYIGDFGIRTSYPVLPWIGVMSLGFLCGKYFHADMSSQIRKSMLLALGAGSVVTFILLRMSNIYGDTAMWHSHDGQVIHTIMSFLNVT